MSVSAPVLDLAALQRLRTGAEVLTYGPVTGREDRWRAIDDYGVTPNGARSRWAHIQTCEVKTDAQLVGAFLMSRQPVAVGFQGVGSGGAAHGGYGGGSAGMTSSSWVPSVPLAMSPAQWSATAPLPAPRRHTSARAATPAIPTAPPRALVPGMRAPTAEEVALLPPGSIIANEADPVAYIKAADGKLYDDGGETIWETGLQEEILVRVGRGDQPGAYLAPDCSPDALVDLLLSRADLRDALAARVPALRDLADALRELVGLQGSGK